MLESIALCIPALVGGGAERVMINMAGWWATRGVIVHLITFTKDAPAYPLHPDIKRLSIDDIISDCPLPEPLWPEETFNITRLRGALKQCLSRTSVYPLPVVSFLTRMNMRLLLAARGLPCRGIVSERVHPPLCPLPAHEETLRRILYPEADRVVFQTETSRRWGCTFLQAEKCITIPNCVERPTELSAPNNLLHLADKTFFLAAGRLVEQKRFDRLLKAFAPLAAQQPDLYLVLAGEGPLKSSLEEQAKALGLQGRLILPGFVNNLSWIMRRALAFVLSSDFEGFPNVLLESLANSCPVIASDCPTGPKEIVRHNVDGLLVKTGDIQALHAAMSSILTSSDLRDRLSRQAKQALERFSAERIMEQWNKKAILCNIK